MRDLAQNLRPLSINTATVRQEKSLKAVAEALAARGISGVAPWREQIQATGIRESARILADHGLAVSGLIRAGIFTAEGRAGLAAVLDDNRRAVDEAAGIGAGCLVLIGGGLMRGTRDLAGSRALVAEGIAALLPYAR